MKLQSLLAALAASLVFASGALAQAPQEKAPDKTKAAAAVVAPPITPAATPALTGADLEAWLDGYMPYALSTADIAGAVVVVVKDGQVILEKGYGYSDVKTHARVDPKTTLFRPGSVSKLFTWTAVMQQVEAGKLDLDHDINEYLDFKIEGYGGQPIKLRHLMTHTAGFEESLLDLLVTDLNKLKPLGEALKDSIPARIYPPGTVPAYSNYGASLAGYIVSRVSGVPFEQ